MKRKFSGVVLIVCILFSALVTFFSTYILLDWRNKLDKRDLSAEYTKKVNEMESEYSDNIDKKQADIERLERLIAEFEEIYSDNPIIQKIATVDYLYKSGYVGTLVDSDTVEDYLVEAYVRAMGDKYATYYNKENYSSLFEQNTGTTYGIGITVAYNEEVNGIEILIVSEGSPAKEVGLKKGDIIIKADGYRLQSKEDYSDFVNKVKGEEGTKVKLTALRGGEEIEFEVTRRLVEGTSVLYEKFVYDNSIGIVKVLEFNEATPKQFKNAVNALLNDGAKSIVFDMRGNPGGLLSSVVEILDFLLPEGDIVHIISGSGELDRTYTSDSNCINVPMAVIVNGSTASAAELFTSALKDYEKAVIVGTNTYGKGTVQSVLTLYDGTALSYSTYMYTPPKSENFEGKGIAPDFTVEENDIIKNNNLLKVSQEDDNQLIAACEKLGYNK